MQIKKVLVVACANAKKDFDCFHWIIQQFPADCFRVIHVATLQGARSYLASQRQIDAIVISYMAVADCSLWITVSIEFIRHTKRYFSGPIIGFSDSEDEQKLLLEAGSTHVCNLQILPEVLRKIFSVQS